jgi:hypothetical protein
MKTTIVSSIFILVLWGSVSSIFAAEFTVNDTADAIDINPGDGICETISGNGTCTLRGAIIEANASVGKDTIIIPAGVYTLTIAGSEEFYVYDGAIADLDITDAVDIRGADKDTTIIQAGTAPGELGSRVIHIQYGIDVSISDVTVQHGIVSGVDQGAGIFTLGNLTLTNCHIRNNTAASNSDGGGLANQNGTTLVENCSFSGNEALAGGSGGGAYGLGGSLTIRDSHFVNNTASDGGGVSGSAVVERCHFENNTAGLGGAIGGYGVRVFNSVLVNNTASRGGGYYAAAGNPLIVNTIISDNTADTRGGGVYFDNTYRAVVENSLITSNRAPTGAGIRSEQGLVNLNHSTSIIPR